MFAFRCSTCGQVHQGPPAFAWAYPLHYLEIPADQRERRCVLTPDTCVIDDAFFFVRGCLDIPVIGESVPFSWGVWTSLSRNNFANFEQLLNEPKRSHHGPFLGWLCSHIWPYPETLNLKAAVHLRDDDSRPFIELEPNDHPLANEQRTGITVERVRELVEKMQHPPA